MSVAIRLSGFLFLFIIVTNVASGIFGYKIDEYDSDAKLRRIAGDPRRFQISVVLACIEHMAIIALAMMLFAAFSSYNETLGVIWVAARTAEGAIQLFSEFGFWGLLKIARQYAGATGTEKTTLSDAGRAILKARNARYRWAMILFGIGTLAYSILFVTDGLVPAWIGWFGIIVGFLDVLGNGIRQVKSDSVAVAYVGGLLTLLFEVILGGWLLFASHAIL